jgi:hypothetical protein
MDLGELEEKVADLEAKLKYEANPYTTYYLKVEKEKFEKQIQRIKDNYAVAVQYSARDKKYKDSTKNLNPAVDIVLHVNINGKEQKPVKGTVFRFNKNGGIEASVLKQSDDKALEQMKTDVYTTSARLEDAKNKLMMLQMDSTKNEDQRVREALQAQSSQLFLQNKLNTLEKNLKLLRRSFTPLFYVPLAKLTPRKSIARALSPFGVSRVFAVRQVAPKNIGSVTAKAQGDHAQQQQGRVLSDLICLRVKPPRTTQQHQAIGNVHDACVALKQADNPDRTQA